MKLIHLLVFTGLVFCGGLAQAEAAKNTPAIQITEPKTGDVVEESTHVRFTPSAIPAGWKLSILVNPEAAGSKWWVQRRPEPSGAGPELSALCHFGTAGAGAGEPFRILVVATRRGYPEGEELILDQLPKDAIKSAIVGVTRKK